LQVVQATSISPAESTSQLTEHAFLLTYFDFRVSLQQCWKHWFRRTATKINAWQSKVCTQHNTQLIFN